MQNTPLLKKVERLDSITLDQTYFTEEGYLVDHPIVTSTGIFEYQNSDGSTRRELRLPENVFDPESLGSYKGKPIIVTHDAGMVDKDNVDDEMIGTILSPGYQDGEHVRAEIVIHNTDTLKQCGLRELSLGYSLELDETPGEWNNQPYDAVQTQIRVNHLALVKNARAGETARLNVDGRDKPPKEYKNEKKGRKQNMKQRTKRTDENTLSPEEMQEAIKMYQASKAQPATDEEDTTPDAKTDEEETSTKTPEETISTVKENKDRRDSQKEGAEGENVDEDTVKQMDEDISSLLALVEKLMAEKEFDEADPPKETATDEEEKPNTDSEEAENAGDKSKSGSLNMDAADRMISQKIELVRLGDQLNLGNIESMSILEGKKAIIRKVRPALRLDGKGATYIQAAFDLAKEELSKRKDTNYQRRQMFNGDSRNLREDQGISSAEKSRQKMMERQLNGGKN